MQVNEQIEINREQQAPPINTFPKTPFENIGFALSGGGFRAAAYGLGVLSLLHYIQWREGEEDMNLLEKISFISSASGGTITLAVYTAAIHHQIPFTQFYRHLNHHLTGEAVVGKAITILEDSSLWTPAGKSRNLINAFARAYHELFFSLVPEKEKILGSIMADDVNNSIHVKEFCFNSTDFYTGISFRFQAAQEWSGNKGGKFGNANIGINLKEKDKAIKSLQQIRLGDVLAASSCFPLGFEPIVFPKDFTYSSGPSVEELKNAMTLDMLSWDDKKPDEENLKSGRAEKEKKFATAKVFGLMDGGICDNEGLDSLLLAHKRDENADTDEELSHRFDLMMVSDVTSYYMSPYMVPEINTNKVWMKKTLSHYWQWLRKIFKKVDGWSKIIFWISLVIVAGFSLPLILEGISSASVILAIVGVVIFIGVIILKKKYHKLLNKYPEVRSSMAQPTLEDLVKLHVETDSFKGRTAIKVTGYLQGVQTGVILQMINARMRSSAVMIGDVFLKHIRRLIYSKLFDNESYFYRRLNNVIYKLTYTNNKGRKLPKFESWEKSHEDEVLYEQRKQAFRDDVENSCRLSPAMQDTAECAYQTGTTLWFDKEQEEAVENNRMALIATGQFTTCYNLLSYSLGLKHSRHFSTLTTTYQQRINAIISQLKTLMIEFEKDPHYLRKHFEQTTGD